MACGRLFLGADEHGIWVWMPGGLSTGRMKGTVKDATEALFRSRGR